MFKTIFAKQFTFYMSALIISFIILAAAMSMTFNDYFISQKSKILQEQASKISDIFKLKYYTGMSEFETKKEIMYKLMGLYEYLEASFIYLDENNFVEYTTSDIQYTWGKIITLDELKPVSEGEIVVLQGNVGGIFSEPVLTVAYPVIINKMFLGTVMLCTSMPELQKSSSEMFSLGLFCLTVSGVVTFIIIFILSRTMTKPLLQMNEVAKVIASGDFEKRITVKSIDEVGQLAESFNNMAESLFEQEQLRRIFISNVSHDLRSPLTSIRGFLQAILDGTIPPEKHNYYLNIIMDETERLSKLTHDIIDLNNIQFPEIELNRTNFDINELIRKTILMFEARVIAKNINVNINFANEKNIVFADIEKIQRVLYNLTDNAEKFTSENGTITIETIVKDKKVKISISDTGKGISIEDQKYVFDRFYKVDTSRGEDRKGSGLGLSIVMAFIRAHNETITLKSEVGKGSTFCFSLPLAK